MTQVHRKRLRVAQDLHEKLHISDLPDGVLGHIMSILPIKDAIKTSLLSRDWEHKWTLMTDIEIDDGEYDESLTQEYRTASFINFVYKVLIRTCNSTLSRFFLRCSVEYHPSYLEMWISMALRRNVERLIVFALAVPRIESSWCFSGWTSLTELELCLSCTLIIPIDNYSFPKLKKLHLISSFKHGNIRLKTVQPTADCIVLNFPVLEDLAFVQCIWLDVSVVEIHAPELITFDTVCPQEEIYYEIKIFATKLATIEIHDCFCETFDLHTPAVSHATFFLPFRRTMQEHLNTILPRAHKVLKSFTGVKYLRLSCDILKHFKSLVPSSGLVFPTFGQLKEVYLDYDCYIEDAISVLQVFPPLDSLTLNVMLWDDDSERGEPWPPKTVSTLKKMKLVDFNETKLQYDFSKFVLENATNLVELVVCLYDGTVEIEEVSSKLSNLIPKTSSCRIVFEEWDEGSKKQ